MRLIKKLIYSFLLSLLVWSCKADHSGQTEITKWQYNKKGAISITYDDGSINQFKNAMPVMDSLGFPGTFFIVTGEIPGSQYKANFIGRPAEEIIRETKTIRTNKDNFFERASAIGFLGYKGTLDYHFKAGDLFEDGKIQEAYQLIDSAFAKVREGKLSKDQDISWEASQSSYNTWDDFNKYAATGHEFASHTISHPRLAVLDEPNLLYELEKSKEEIFNHLGAEYIFSAECPFGTEDERVMNYAYKIYPALRNRMPESFLEELNRWNKKSPGSSEKEYVQWQRGGLTEIPADTMKAWVDTVVNHDNIWLVLVFHGVDGIGWSPRTTTELRTYFEYIKTKENDVWVATFGKVTKYIRERMSSNISNSKNDNKIIIDLTHSLDKNVYNEHLTLKTYIEDDWEQVQVKQNDKFQSVKSGKDEKGRFIIYQAVPNTGTIEISKSNVP